MKFDPIVFNALKKEQNDLAGVIVQDLQDKIVFNSQPVDNRVVDLHAIPAIKNKMRWDYPGATYKFNLYAPGSATLIDGDSVAYYAGMDFNPDDGYIYFCAASSVYRVHQDRIGIASHELVHESTKVGNTAGDYFACRYLGQNLLMTATLPKTGSYMVQIINTVTNVATDITTNYQVWFSSFKLNAVLFKNKIFFTQLALASDVYPNKTQRIKSANIDLTGITDVAFFNTLVGGVLYVIDDVLYVSGYENSYTGNLVVYSSADGVNFTLIGTLLAKHHKAVLGSIESLHPHQVIGKSIVFSLYRGIYEFNTVTKKFSFIYDASPFMQGDTFVRLLGYLPADKKLLLAFTAHSTQSLKDFRVTTMFAINCKINSSDNTLSFGKIRKIYRIRGYSHYGVLQTSNGTIVKNNIATTTIHITRPKQLILSATLVPGNKQLEYRLITGIDGSK